MKTEQISDGRSRGGCILKDKKGYFFRNNPGYRHVFGGDL